MSDTTNRPIWMNDASVADIPAAKLEFLEKMFQETQGKSQKELMSLLMPMMKKARQEHLTFTPAEMNAAISAIKKYSTPDEAASMNQILEKAKSHKL